jgi:hypothetical protein
MRFHGNQWSIKAGKRTAVEDGKGHGIMGMVVMLNITSAPGRRLTPGSRN